MKFPHQDYKMVYRHGYFVDKHTLRREHDSASALFFCIAMSTLIILAVAIQSCNLAGVR